MSQDTLCDLVLISIRRNETEKTAFNDVTDEFSSIKSRKALL